MRKVRVQEHCLHRLIYTVADYTGTTGTCYWEWELMSSGSWKWPLKRCLSVCTCVCMLDVLRLWDALLSDKHRFDFLIYVCCAMIMWVVSHLISTPIAVTHCHPCSIAQQRRYCFQSCLFVCVDVCQLDNSWTVRKIITKFSVHQPVVRREARFKNGCIGVGSCRFNCFFCHRHDLTSPSRSQWTRP